MPVSSTRDLLVWALCQGTCIIAAGGKKLL